MTDQLPVAPAGDPNAAMAAGVAEAIINVAPEIAIAAGAANPQLQAALIAAQALEPAVAQLAKLVESGLMTQEQLDATIVTIKANAAGVHAAWLATVGLPAK